MPQVIESETGSFHRSIGLAKGQEDVALSKARLRTALCKLIALAVGEGDWRMAVTAAVNDGGLTEADVASSLEIARSTVNRWLSGQTEPPTVNIPTLGRKLISLVEQRMS